jgi:GT2 family glycosyltransferase
MKRLKSPEEGYIPVVDYPEGLIEVDVTGAGCLLIHRSVFEKLAYPWFLHPRVDYSEDVYFLRNAKKAGYKVYVDTTVKCLHDTTMTVSEAMFKGNQ